MSQNSPRNFRKTVTVNHHRKRCIHQSADGSKCTGFAVNHNSIAPENRIPYCYRHRENKGADNTTKHQYEKPDECPVCYEETENLMELKPCNHWLCKTCLDKITKNECPYCRTQLQMNLNKAAPINPRYDQYRYRRFPFNNRRQFLESSRMLFNLPASMGMQDVAGYILQMADDGFIRID